MKVGIGISNAKLFLYCGKCNMSYKFDKKNRLHVKQCECYNIAGDKRGPIYSDMPEKR